MDLKSRLLNRIKVNETTGCWEWQGCRAAVHDKIVPTDAGYGRMTYKGFVEGTHRLSYRIYKGPIPDGMIVCHSCDNRPCCNPDHLFLGTDESNADDKSTKGRHPRNGINYCKHGHEYTPENLIWFTTKTGKPARACRTCRRDHSRRRRADPATREKIKKQARIRAKTPERRAKHAAYMRARNAKKRRSIHEF